MDPCTQSLLGATVASSFSKKHDYKKACFLGAIGGIVPDLDILINSSDDQLLFLEYHRHFTHSLLFIPFGGLILSSFFFLLFNFKTSFKNMYFYCTLGVATHCLLDACTTYGTSLFWPFANERFAWNIISIIDPIFTLILLTCIIFLFYKKSLFHVRLGFVLSLIYIFLGYQKNLQVKSYITKISEIRGHNIERLMVNPTIGNIILWRTVYEYNDKYYVDAIYFPYFSNPKIKKGHTLNVIDKEKIFPELGNDSRQRKDIRRFSYFTNDYIYIHPDNKFLIADLRYGTLPHDIQSLWGIEIDPKNLNNYVHFKNLRNFNNEIYSEFWEMLKGNF